MTKSTLGSAKSTAAISLSALTISLLWRALVGSTLGIGTARAQETTAGTPTTLPRPDFKFQGKVGKTYKESDPPEFPRPIAAPKGAPNVVLILLDDTGFGQYSTFGGGIPSPTLDKLAAEGLRYNRFHTTALCSPTRAALITGRNHHSAATGVITEAATGYDGYTCILPRSCGTIGEVLRQPLGQRPRLRLLLRLQRRRYEPLGSGAFRKSQFGSEECRSDVPPDRGLGRPGNFLGS